jgi:hypothetical protein
MAKGFHSAEVSKCYSCIQWEGDRSFDRKNKTIRADLRAQGNCLLWRKLTSGRSSCDKVERLR